MLPAPLLPSTAPAVGRDALTGDLIVNANGRTELRLHKLVLVDPVRIVQEVTIVYRGSIRTRFISVGALSDAVLHALMSCFALGMLRRPMNTRRQYVANHVWQSPVKTRVSGLQSAQIGCACQRDCPRHPPLFTMTVLADGRRQIVALGKVFVDTETTIAMPAALKHLVLHRVL